MACKNCGHSKISHIKNVGGKWMMMPCNRTNNYRACDCEDFVEDDFDVVNDEGESYGL